MKFGYLRVPEDLEEYQKTRSRMLELVEDDRFLFEDVRSKEYDRKNYGFLCGMLRSGDLLYVDGLESLGRTPEQMALEWKRLTAGLGVDVVTVNENLSLDSRHFKALGAAGQEMEQLMLHLLQYISQQQRRKLYEGRKSGESGKGSGNFGRPPLQLDWELFHKTAQRWADGEIDVQEACEITGSARSSWYKYAKEAGYVRGNKRTRKKSE